jgi:hypothetical protein
LKRETAEHHLVSQRRYPGRDGHRDRQLRVDAEKRNKVNQALNLVRSSNPKDEVFVVNFNDEYYLAQDFTNNLLKMKKR